MKHRRMNGYSEDPGYPEPTTFETLTKAQATRTFDVSLSSVKRYANKVHRRESLAPKKSPGSASKLDQGARQLLAEDLTLRPYGHSGAALRLHGGHEGVLGEPIHHVSGHSQDRLRQEKGDDLPPKATSSQEQPGG